MLNTIFYLALTFFIVLAAFLILLVLIQKGRGGGLSSAFGGSGGSTAFGTKTGDVLTWATSVVFGLFIFMAVVLNLTLRYQRIHPAGSVSPASNNIPIPVTPAKS